MRKAVTYFALGGLIFLASAGVSYGMFTLFAGKEQKFDAVGASPEEVVNQYRVDSQDFWKGYSAKDKKSVYLGYLEDQKGRIYELAAQEFVVYEKGDDEHSLADVKQQVDREFTRLELSRIVDTDEYATYENENKRCQVLMVTQPVGSFGVSCNDKATIEKQATLAPLLFDLYAQTDGAELDATKKSRITITVQQTPDTTIQYATMSFSGAETSQIGLPRPLFGAVDGTWEYVANLFNQEVPSDGQRSVSESDLGRMNNPKWKGYLSEVF